MMLAAGVSNAENTRQHQTDHQNDTERFHAGMAYFIRNGASLEDAMARMLPLAEGGASFIAMDKTKIVAARDVNGIRPLAMGKRGENVVFASETVALDAIDATYLREVRPGEMIVADRRGIGSIQSHQIMEGRNKLDLFEMIYFAHPDSFLYGRRVRDIREDLGRELFREAPKIQADIVVSAPDSATPAAIGYAKAAREAALAARNIPSLFFDPEAVKKNPDAQRTFIHPDPVQRLQMLKEKFILDPARINGKRVILVEDSIVRSSTAVVLIQMLKDAGASEVHMMVHSPPIRWPELHGVDLPEQDPLIAFGRSVEQVRQLIKADSLTYLSMEGTMRAIGTTQEYFSTGPFTGEYPTDIGKRVIDRTFYDFYQELHAKKNI
jgi:amidophosphoribosyltransferase